MNYFIMTFQNKSKSVQSSESEFVPCKVMHFVCYTKTLGQGWAGIKIQLQYIFLWSLVPRGKAPFSNLQKGTKWDSGNPKWAKFSQSKS